jgi:hypothetical protein
MKSAELSRGKGDQSNNLERIGVSCFDRKDAKFAGVAFFGRALRAEIGLSLRGDGGVRSPLGRSLQRAGADRARI